MFAAGEGEKLAQRLLARDEGLLDRARVDRGLKKRRARRGEAVEVGLEGAGLGVGGGVNKGVVGAGA